MFSPLLASTPQPPYTRTHMNYFTYVTIFLTFIFFHLLTLSYRIALVSLQCFVRDTVFSTAVLAQNLS